MRNARLHVLEVDSPMVRETYALSAEASIEALLRLHELEQAELTTLRATLQRELLDQESTTARVHCGGPCRSMWKIRSPRL